jgi:hypothetical protein
MAVIEHPDMQTRSAPWIGAEPADERAAREDLRAQIGHLERRLAHVAASTYPRLDMSPVTPRLHHRTPRVLALGELELVRDALAGRLATLRRAALRQAEEQADAREALERMLADPPAHPGRRMTNAQLGLPGCTVYAVVPRLGVVGRLAGWWQVKVSSGCPLAWGP